MTGPHRAGDELQSVRKLGFKGRNAFLAGPPNVENWQRSSYSRAACREQRAQRRQVPDGVKRAQGQQQTSRANLARSPAKPGLFDELLHALVEVELFQQAAEEVIFLFRVRQE